MERKYKQTTGMVLIIYGILVVILGSLGYLRILTSNIIGLIWLSPVVTLGVLVVGLVLVFKKKK